MRSYLTLPALVVLGAGSAAVAAEPYRLEKTHADLLFSINHAGFTEKHGAFREFDATLQYDPQSSQKSQVEVTVKIDSLDTGFGPRDQDVLADKFLDAAHFPQMRFVSTKVTPGPQGTLLVEGNLTLRGVTKPLKLHAKLNKVGANPFDGKPTLGFSASGTLKRSDFGIATAIPIIGDDVTIAIDAEFNQKKP